MTLPTLISGYQLDHLPVDLSWILLPSKVLQNTSAEMNPTEVLQLQAFITHQGKLLGAYQDQLAVFQPTQTHLMDDDTQVRQSFTYFSQLIREVFEYTARL